MSNLHIRIKTTRQSLGISQARLAADTGVSQPTVANWETGSHIPRQRALERISIALGVDEDWLLSGKEDKALRSANRYLSTPIRHIPIYADPATAQDWRSGQPKGFLPYPTENTETFAIISHQKNVLLILESPTQDIPADAPCVWLKEHTIEISEFSEILDRETIVGRLRAEVKTY